MQCIHTTYLQHVVVFLLFYLIEFCSFKFTLFFTCSFYIQIIVIIIGEVTLLQWRPTSLPSDQLATYKYAITMVTTEATERWLPTVGSPTQKHGLLSFQQCINCAQYCWTKFQLTWARSTASSSARVQRHNLAISNQEQAHHYFLRLFLRTYLPQQKSTAFL